MAIRDFSESGLQDRDARLGACGAGICSESQSGHIEAIGYAGEIRRGDQEEKISDFRATFTWTGMFRSIILQTTSRRWRRTSKSLPSTTERITMVIDELIDR